MTQTSGDLQNTRFHKDNSWQWIFRILLTPKAVFNRLAAAEGRHWVRPMLILTLLVAVLSLAGGPARLENVQQTLNQPPEDFQYWTEDQQNQFFQGQMSMQGPLFIYIFPLLEQLAGLWLGWFLLASLLHLLMTFKGSRRSREVYHNFTAWAAIPFALRALVQIAALLAIGESVDDPGLSGFIAPDASGFMIYLRLFFALVDIYSLWFFGLILYGSPTISGLKSGKAVVMALIACVVFLILVMVPGFIRIQLGGLGAVRPFLFF
jgi:hypothetical protein